MKIFIFNSWLKSFKRHHFFIYLVLRFSFPGLLLIMTSSTFASSEFFHDDDISSTLIKSEDNILLEKILKQVEIEAYDSSILRQALIVRLANQCDITMYGRQINDVLTENSLLGRRKYEVHPYGKAGVAVSTLVVCKLLQDQEIYLLLGKKYSNPLDKSLGLKKMFILFGGYMKPHPLEGYISHVERIADEDKDLAEEAILLKKDGYALIDRGFENRYSESRRTAKSDEVFDFNLEAAAVRELSEETGLLWDFSAGSPKFLGTRSDYGMTSDKRLHVIVSDYLFDYGECFSFPETKAGSDIAEVTWMKLRNVFKDCSVSAQEADSALSRYSVLYEDSEIPIMDHFGEVIETYAHSIGAPLNEKNSKL